jgi:hypothetical protein
MSRKTALVGAYGQQGNVVGYPSGAAYVYDVSDPANPVRRRKLLPAGATGSERWNFGISVALRGNLAVVAARIEGDNGGMNATGMVFLFDLRTGEELSRFTASDFQPGDGFGTYMAIDGNTLIVSALFTSLDVGDTRIFGAGAAYIFDVSEPRNPVERFKLTASDPDYGVNFGHSVAISGDLAVVGAPFRTEGENEEGPMYRGGAYVFDVTTGEELARIPPQDPIQPGEHPAWSYTGLGWSVGISGRTAVVGSPFAHDGNYNGYGGAHLFDLSNPWEPVRIFRFSPSDGDDADWFGISVAMGGGRILIGAPQLWSWGGKALLYRGPER